MGELEGRVALVTAGSRGVGRAIAEAFLDEGASVVLNGRTEAKGRQTLDELDAGAAARFVAADVMQRDECERLLDETIAAYGHIDILVNNAGGAADNAPVAEMSDRCLSVALDWCLWSTFWCMRRALNDMIPRGW